MWSHSSVSEKSRYKTVSESSHSVSVTLFGSCEATCSEFVLAHWVLLSVLCIYLFWHIHLPKRMCYNDLSFSSTSRSWFPLTCTLSTHSGLTLCCLSRILSKNHWAGVVKLGRKMGTKQKQNPVHFGLDL